MKILNAFCATALLIAGSSFAYADDDISLAEAVELLKAGTIKPVEQLNAAALASHPDGVIGETELEHVNGTYVYKVEVRDAAGQEWDVDVDAGTGAVLSDKPDN